MLMAMVDMVLVLGTSPFTPRKVILEDTGIMEGFRHLRESTQHPLRCYLILGIIQFVIRMFLCLVLLLEMVNVLWVLGTPTLNPKNMIVVLIMVICFVKE